MTLQQSTEERPARTSNGFVYVAAGIVLLLAGIGLFAMRPVGLMIVLVVIAVLLAMWCLTGLYMLQPNQAALLLLFGSYRGTDRDVDEAAAGSCGPFFGRLHRHDLLPV